MRGRATAVQRTLSSYSRVQILYALQQSSELTIDKLSEICDLHPNTVREHVHRLIDDGFVLSRNELRDQRGRPRVVYRAARGTESHHNMVLAAKTRLAHERSEVFRRVLPDMPQPESEKALVRQLDALDDHLDQAGFDPVTDQSNRCVDLTRCPFADMVDAHPQVVCSVHFELIKTVLAQVGGPVSARELLPFVQADRCRVSLDFAPASIACGCPECSCRIHPVPSVR